VSVILSTRREEWLEHALSQVARQNYEPRELVVCLHGEGFSDGIEDWLRREWQGRLVIVRPAAELVLGDALNAGVEAATGEYVTKMDDDDPYSVDHLWDLVLALEYADADLVGKAAEFVYLEEIDLTIRRFMGDTETPSRRLAGGGMMARRDSLRAIGGWPSRGRGEDTALVRRFDEADQRIHRTHGFGYILNRHGRDHTWRPYVDYFLVQSEFEWRGLRYDKAGIY
jgi:GT2 family glycosyltransferase